jgi:tetratricopeptide (TPR) repeat protein
MKVFGIILSALFLSTLTFAQCDKLENHPDGKEAALRLFVYRDFVKNKQYEEALPNWTELYTHCKAGNGNILKDGIKMYTHFAKTATEDDKKKENYEKVITMMQERIDCYGNNKRKKTGLKYAGYRYYEMGKLQYKELGNYPKALEAFDKSMELDGNKVEKNLLTYYAFMTVKQFRAEEIDAEKTRAVHDQLMELMNSDLATFEDTKAAVAKEFDKIARDIFDCDYFVAIVEPTFYANYNDAEFILEDVIKTLKRRKCEEDEPLLAKAMTRYKAIQDSIREGNRDLIDKGSIALKGGNTSEAKNYYAQGIADGNIPQGKRYTAAMRLAKLHQKDKEWSSALSMFRKCTELNSNTGAPYISIGMLYLSANKTCSGFDRQLVAGAALDQFRKAKKFSDSASDASDKISTYGAYLPTKEILFQKGISVGARKTVGCVLSASTTVQSK